MAAECDVSFMATGGFSVFGVPRCYTCCGSFLPILAGLLQPQMLNVLYITIKNNQIVGKYTIFLDPKTMKNEGFKPPIYGL